MTDGIRENAPVLLVPLAWTFATVAHLDMVTVRTALIAHVVMDVIIVAFTALSWSDMSEGVLRAWRAVLLVGLGLTLVGTAALAMTPRSQTVLAGTVVGGMVVPAAGLAYTGEHVAPETAPRVYTAGAVLSVLGAVVYVGWFLGVVPATTTLVGGLTLVNLGQTAGIVNAVVQY